MDPRIKKTTIQLMGASCHMITTQKVIAIGTVCCQIFLKSFEAATYAFLRRRYGGKEKESFKKCPKIFSKNESILNRVDKK